MTDKFGKVAVLYGGESSEREVSLASGQAVYDALISRGVDAHLVDTKDHQAVLNLKANGFARAFVMLHGIGGEDGQIQAVLNWLGMPYTGSKVTACAVGMDKILTKRVWQACGLPVLGDCILQEGQSYGDLCTELNATQFAVKPTDDGSSVGISCVASQAELDAARKAMKPGVTMMVEPWVEGRELTYGVVGEEVLPGIEIIPSDKHAFYDYQAKYQAEDTRYLCPPAISDALNQTIEKMTLKAFKTIGARGWGRVDFMIDKENRPWLLEINLAPGMTSHSLVPQAAKKAGKSFADIVLTILEQTLVEDE